MELLLILIILLALYGRTWNYKNLIDDCTPRDKAPWYTVEVDYHFYDKKRPIMYVVTNITVFYFACVAMYLNFGFYPALLYAVIPTNTQAGTWQVGSFYMTTTLFLLTGYYYMTHYEWGWIVSAVMYLSALNSTVSAMPYIAVIIIWSLLK